MIRFRKRISAALNVVLTFLLFVWQASFALAPFIASRPVTAAPVCVNDTAGPNDEPGQKDLTRLCVDEANLPTSVHVTWNWDELGTSGANTMDACALFDTDNDGNINYSICVITEDDPATQIADSPKIYSCGDDKIDRCTSPLSLLAGPYASTCSISQGTQPFTSGAGSGVDTVATCTLMLSDVGGAIAELVDVCSYPSQQPNSDPSDCVIIQDRSGKLEVRKNLIPASDSGLFNLQIDDTTHANNVGDGGTTGEVIVSEGNHSVGETAGTGTSLTSYSTSIECRDLNGTGSVIASGTGATLASVSVADASDIVCIITNTASSSITIIKNTVPDDGTDFSFTTTTLPGGNFQLDDDSDPTLSNNKLFNGLTAGAYDVSETANASYTTTSSCTDGSPVSAIVLSAGENVTCTFTNTKKGHLIVQKTTDPSGDPTVFTINASGTGTITGGGAATITDAFDQDYEVTPGTYSVAETVPSGWSKTGDTCQNVVVAAGQTVTCTITNTKLAKLKIIKDSVPDSSQDFTFTTTGDGLSGFILDDDTDATRSNQQQFVDLSPGSYSVTEAAVGGWDLTDLTCGGHAISQDGLTLNITLAAGEDVTCTFTNTERGSISGVKFNDLNGNGVLDQGEPTLSDWTIFIDANSNGLLDALEASTSTDVSGAYIFSNLISGVYSLAEVLLNGWTQTLAPNAVNLQPGQTSSDNNFGNFQNGSVSGFKFNDLNGNGQFDEGEPKLQGWTMTLFNDNDDADDLLNNVVATTQTDSSGNYSFTNLTAGSYQVCETLQAGWVQTFPANNGCHIFIIDASGESNTANFGNQGRGTIKVVKNVDTDGNGTIDQSDVTDWTWDINGSGNFATGSGNPQNVAAGSYTVSEDQKTDFHVTGSSCSGETPPISPSTSLNVTASPGENVTCTFTNTRDTGTITVRKTIDPNTDNGLFDLQIDGVTRGDDVGHGGSTGTVSVTTGNHSVAELAGAGTNLNDYISSFTCTGETPGSGTSTSVTVAAGEDVVCVFTNVRKGHIIVIKQTNPDGSSQVFNFTASYDSDGFSLTDGQSNDSGNLNPGTYSVSENAVAGWDLKSATCSDSSNPSSVSLQAGETVTCTFTNEQDANIIVVKQTDPDGSSQMFNFTASYDADGFSLSDGQSNDSGDLDPGTYSVAESATTGWDLTSATCSDSSSPSNINLSAGETVTCTFVNQQDAHIIITKQTDPDGNSQVFNFSATYDADGFSLSDGQSNDSGDLDPGTYSVSETVPAGWGLESAFCSDSSNPNSINLSAGETVTCTFTNEQDAHIIVTKQTNPDGSAQVFNFSASYDSDGFSLSDGQSNDSGDLDPGTYSVSETIPTGWDLDSVVCSDQSNPSAISLQAGETVTCTFTNEQDAKIVVIKQTNPDGASETFNFSASYDIDGFTLSDGQSNNSGDLDPGSYSISEFETTGWDFTSIDCQGSNSVNINGSSVTINLAAGQTVTCTFLNTQRGKITGTKYEVDVNATDGSGANALSGWTIFLDLNDNGELDAEEPFITTGSSGNYNFENLVPGNFTVCEVLQSGWTQVFPAGEPGCHTVTVDAGETDSGNDFGNFRGGSISGYKFNDVNGDADDEDGTEPKLSGWEIKLFAGEDLVDTAITAQSGSYSFADLPPGTYRVCETLQENWQQTFPVGCHTIVINESGESNQAIFGNRGRGKIIVVKNLDTDNNGEVDEQDVNDWQWGYSGDFGSGSDIATGSQNGQSVFAGNYNVTEEQQVNHRLLSVSCSGEEAVDQAEAVNITVSPGEEVICTFVNQQIPVVLNIQKSNDQPTPTVAGDTVMYTIVVSLPEDSGVAFDTVVTDLPPENFNYINGSWTAASSVRGNIKNNPTTEPTYTSPGQWILGDLQPGEVVTLTYLATIANSVTPGDYPDVAFGSALDLPEGSEVLAACIGVSCLDEPGTPLVGTQVAVVTTPPSTPFSGQVLGVLVDTGTALTIFSILVPAGLIISTLILGRLTKRGYKI